MEGVAAVVAELIVVGLDLVFVVVDVLHAPAADIAEVAALMARRTSIVASMQNLRAMAEEAVPNMELTEIISGGEVTAPQPRERKQAK